MASTSITTAFVKQYGSTLDLLAQTKGGKFTGTCLEESIEGEEKYYDQLGAVYASEVTDRYADSPENDITHARRRVVATPYDVGLMLDKFDKVQMLVNPESEYVQQQVTALNRKKDIEFIKGALGTAQTGKTGSTSTAFDTTNQRIAHDYDGAGGSADRSLTLQKLSKARSIFGENGIDLDDPLNKAYIAVSPQVIQDMLNTEKTTSVDFNSIKALIKGELSQFYGFEFIVSNLVPFFTNGTEAVSLDWTSADAPTGGTANNRACIAWVKSGIRQVTNPSIMTEISKRDDKRFNYYAYSCMRTGAVRMEEKKVIQINCIEGVGI